MNWIDTIQTHSIGKSSRLKAISLVSETETIFNAPKRVVLSIIHVLLNWHRDRMERTALRTMDEHMLKDIGVTRGQADHMARDRWIHRDIRKLR
jgi:uncharacterized protein YjiS (DUF1127 family)